MNSTETATSANTQPASESEAATPNGNWASTPTGIGVITTVVIIVVALVLFAGIYWGVVVPGQNSNNTSSHSTASQTSSAGSASSVSGPPTSGSFDITWISPLMSPSTLVQTIDFIYAPFTQAVTLTVPPLSWTQNNGTSGFGLIAPGTSTFPNFLGPITALAAAKSQSLFQITNGNITGTGTFTWNLNPEGTVTLNPATGTTLAFQANSGRTYSFAGFTLSYTAVANPSTYAYGILPLTVTGPMVNGSVPQTLYYATAGTNVYIACPTVTFDTNSTAGDLLASASGVLPGTIVPVSDTSFALNPAYSVGESSPNNDTITVQNIGRIVYTNISGNFAINQNGQSFGCGLINFLS